MYTVVLTVLKNGRVAAALLKGLNLQLERPLHVREYLKKNNSDGRFDGMIELSIYSAERSDEIQQTKMYIKESSLMKISYSSQYLLL